MESSRNNHLGINKVSRSIRKSPLHQPPYQQQQPQPQVYNISKNDFRSIVQQLTGTPSRDPNPNPNPNPNPIPPAPAPPRPPHPKPSSLRLQRIRPPPLAPIARNPNPNPGPVPGPGFLPRPGWADSPVSAYMRYLETSLLQSDGSRPPGVLPSLPPPLSPSSYLNLLSPRSPYPLLSPGFQYPPPLTPNFSLSPLPPGQQGILGPGPLSPMPPLSPGLFFPSSPSGFFPLMSPRWRDM